MFIYIFKKILVQGLKRVCYLAAGHIPWSYSLHRLRVANVIQTVILPPHSHIKIILTTVNIIKELHPLFLILLLSFPYSPTFISPNTLI